MCHPTHSIDVDFYFGPNWTDRPPLKKRLYRKQIAAAGGALRSLGAVILEDHLKGCVATAIETHDNASQMISEVIDLFNKFTK